MNPEAAHIAAEGFLRGFFDVLSTLLPEPAEFVAPSVAEFDAQANSGDVAAFDACMRADVAGGGSVMVLFQARHLLALAAAAMDQEPPESPEADEQSLAEAAEVFRECMGAGAAHFKERFGQVVELENIEAAPVTDAATAATSFGPDAFEAPFTFNASSTGEGAGLLLMTTEWESIVPEDASGGGEDAALGQEELDDILGGFEGAAEPETAEPASGPVTAPPPRSGGVPANIDMIMGVSLTATARLGRVEMPISEILSLGPGSIVDVGHMVDDPIELYVNDRLIARGEVVVVDEKFGLRITHIVSPEERIESLR